MRLSINALSPREAEQQPGPQQPSDHASAMTGSTVATPVDRVPSPNDNFLRDFMLGGIAGGVSKTVVAPLERVKLLLQCQDASTQIGLNSVTQKYTGFSNCFVRVYQEQGFISYWRGTVVFTKHFFDIVLFCVLRELGKYYSLFSDTSFKFCI